MRISTLFALGIFALCLSPKPLQIPHPRPPGLAEAQKQEEKPLEPPMKLGRRVNPQQLANDADELARLGETIRRQVNQLNQQQLPKDLLTNLKRIEQLAKHLRSEVSP